MSSNSVGFTWRSASRMPLDSNWNTPVASPFAQQGERLGVVERQLLHVELGAARLLHQPHGLVDDVEVAQAEEVHLEQAEGVDVAHRVLRDDRLVGALALQRQVLGQVAVADHDGGGVDGVLPHEALERPGHVDQLAGGDRAALRVLADRGRVVVGRLQVLARLQAVVEADLGAFRDHLRDPVDDAERQAQHATGVARRGLRRQLAERDDLRHALAPVLVDHVVHDALAAVRPRSRCRCRASDLRPGLRKRSNSSSYRIGSTSVMRSA